ncbi:MULTISPECIES: YcaO-like family protein [unclassified Crossiella]|uniref:YcaO-like family protein n=1 Tax=unclassified Crossiella TaxID=2620835 RepID=UPI001FFE8DE4|nr:MULTISPECIES: YcaO-like family protein [unclassified Crossiella]MCK2237554.1 YcaO-like family protein [Crossiella sp. S99.2]MCK2254840.1 YcaO-like family protein [Crossiella sp. S99.1]
MSLPPETMVDPLTGIVRRLVDVAPVPGLPHRYRGVTAEVSDARRLGAWPADRVSLGTTFGDVEGARVAALGEAVERYCGNRLPPLDDPRLRRTTAAALAAEGHRHFGPADLPFFAPWQHREPGFPYQEFTPDTELLWTRGEEDGDPCWLPASWVYLNYFTGERRREPRLHHLNYAGIATGADAPDAHRRGLLELLERDALELWWHLGAPTRGIALDSVPGLAADLTGTRLKIHLVELPTEHPVACVAAVAIDEETGIVAGGGAARFDPAEACAKAAMEAIHTWVFTLGLLEPDGWVFDTIKAGILAKGLYLDHRPDRHYRDNAGPHFARVRDLGAQPQIWLDPRTQESLLHRFTNPTTQVTAADLPTGTFPELQESLRAQGCRVATVDLTTPDVAETPWRVLRVAATGLIPNAPAAFRYLGLPRWREAQRARDWAPTANPLTGPEGLVLDPPPFL